MILKQFILKGTMNSQVLIQVTMGVALVIPTLKGVSMNLKLHNHNICTAPHCK
jgi:hypothetical protein